jgi:hypothetical protein
LPAEDRRHLRVGERRHERSQPVRTLRRGVGIQKDHPIPVGESHALVQNPTRPILVGQHLYEMPGFRLTNEFHRFIGGTGIERNELPVPVILRRQGGQGVA